MKTAREAACEYVDACDEHYEVKKHCSRCDELTAAIEARDRELVEACGKIIDRFGAMSIRPSIREVADAVRSLSPTPAEVSRG